MEQQQEHIQEQELESAKEQDAASIKEIRLPDRVSYTEWMQILTAFACILGTVFLVIPALETFLGTLRLLVIPLILGACVFSHLVVTPFLFPALLYDDHALLSIAFIDDKVYVNRTNGATNVFPRAGLRIESQQVSYLGRRACLFSLKTRGKPASTYYVSGNTDELERILAFLSTPQDSEPANAKRHQTGPEQVFAMPTAVDQISWIFPIATAIWLLVIHGLPWLGTMPAPMDSSAWPWILGLHCFFVGLCLWGFWRRQHAGYRIIVFTDRLTIVARDGRRVEFPLKSTYFSITRFLPYRAGPIIYFNIRPFASGRKRRRVRLFNWELSLELEEVLRRCCGSYFITTR